MQHSTVPTAWCIRDLNTSKGEIRANLRLYGDGDVGLIATSHIWRYVPTYRPTDVVLERGITVVRKGWKWWSCWLGFPTTFVVRCCCCHYCWLLLLLNIIIVVLVAAVRRRRYVFSRYHRSLCSMMTVKYGFRGRVRSHFELIFGMAAGH